MEQHPVPQQISSYEFRLVGDMTLKQFGLVAGGVLVALFFYASPLPGFLKWPFLILSAFLGLAMAFLPFEERPLQTWIWSFLKAAYSPTQFLWQKKGQKPEVFEERAAARIVKTAPTMTTQASGKRLTDYLEAFSLARVITEEAEQKFLDRIQNLFSSISEAKQVETIVVPVEEKEKEEEKEEVQWEPQPQVQPRYPHYAPRLPQGARRFPRKRMEEPRFYPQIPMPSVPTTPNILVGMVTDPNGKMVEGAIVEIRDSQGNPVRAFRTNKLSQFRIVTPLPNDTYEIEVEKEGLKFDIIKVTLTGEIVQPIEIRAKE